MTLRVHEGALGGARLRQIWLSHPQPDQVWVWVKSAQSAQSWLDWQADVAPERPLQIGTFRAWPRRWLSTYALPSVLGAQWFMEQVLAQHPELVQPFLDQGWSRVRLVAHLTRWGIERAEGTLDLRLSEELAPRVTALLDHHQAASWAAGVLDTGQQIRAVLAHRNRRVKPHWLCEDLQEWPPAHLALLDQFRAEVTLEVAYDPGARHQQLNPLPLADFLGTERVWVGPASPCYLAACLAQRQPLVAERRWVSDRAQLWPEITAWVQGHRGPRVILIPWEDPLIRANLQTALREISWHWFFPEQKLATSLPAQLVWTALSWLDPQQWGPVTMYDTTQLLELGLGLSGGQALRWARVLQQPLPDLTGALAPCVKLYAWLTQWRGESDPWTSIFTELLVTAPLGEADQQRLAQLRRWGEDLIALGGYPALKILREGYVLPRWAVPVPEGAVLVTNPRHWVHSERFSDHALWVDVTATGWQVMVGSQDQLIPYLQTSLLRNRQSLTLLATPQDGEGQRQEGPLLPLMRPNVN